MLRAVLALSAVMLLVGAVSWLAAGIETLRRAASRADRAQAQDRMHELAARDAVVGALLALAATTAAATAAGDPTGAADWLLALTVLSGAAALPFVQRYRSRTELDHDRQDARERMRLELLYAVAAAGEHLEVADAAQAVADALAPRLGDWGMVVLLDRTGSLETAAISRAEDAAADAKVQRLLERYPVDLDGDVGIGLAIGEGTQVVYEDITDDLLAQAATDAEHLALLRDIGLGAAMIEPLSARGHLVGAIAVINQSGRPLTARVRSLVEEIASHAALVLDNARLHRDLVESERALRFSEAVLRAQGESGVEGLLVVSTDGRMLSHNARFAEMWGFSDEVIEGGNDDDALALAVEKIVDPEAFLEKVRQIYADPTVPTRDEIHLTDGRVFDRYGAPLRVDDGTYVGRAWYFRDVTTERQNERSLIESGERFATLARTLQESLLPPDLPEIHGAEIAACYHPAGDGSEVGGDFYDVFQISDTEWCAVMGDVCGKGAAAARLTALARYTLRASATRSSSIVTNLEVLNTALVRQSEQDRARRENRFATAAVVRFRPGSDGIMVRAGSGGHPPPLVLRPDGSVGTVPCRGSLLGMFDEVRFTPAQLRLGDGETLVAYTDGVTEARRGREEYGEDRLVALLQRCAGSPAADLVRAIEDDVLRFQDGVARDDVAVLAIRAIAPDPPP